MDVIHICHFRDPIRLILSMFLLTGIILPKLIYDPDTKNEY